MFAAKLADALTDDERARCQEELAKHVGAEEAAKFSWLRRLALAADGSMLVEVRRPTVTMEQLVAHGTGYGAAPWTFPEREPGDHVRPGEGGRPAMQSALEYLPLAEAVESLTGPDNPEAEIARRFAALERAVEEQNANVERLQEERRANLAAAKAHRDGRPDRWRELPFLAKLFYTVAEMHDAKTPRQALRTLAKLAEQGERAVEAVPGSFEEHT